MKLEGIHHITAITGDAPKNVEFYVGTLGMRMVKKTVNQDDPTVYHLFYGDEAGSPGFDMTFFEYPGAPRGRAGAGMVHRISWRVGSVEAIDFWAERLASHGVDTEREGDRLRFADPEGLGHELLVSTVADEPLTASAPDIPAEHAIQGFDGARAYSGRPEASEQLLSETLGFVKTGEDGGWEVRGDKRGGLYAYDAPPAERGSFLSKRSRWRVSRIAAPAAPRVDGDDRPHPHARNRDRRPTDRVRAPRAARGARVVGRLVRPGYRWR